MGHTSYPVARLGLVGGWANHQPWSTNPWRDKSNKCQSYHEKFRKSKGVCRISSILKKLPVFWPLLKWKFVSCVCCLVHCLSSVAVVYSIWHLIYKSHVTCVNKVDLPAGQTSRLISRQKCRKPCFSHLCSHYCHMQYHIFGACSRSITVPGCIR